MANLVNKKYPDVVTADLHMDYLDNSDVAMLEVLSTVLICRM